MLKTLPLKYQLGIGFGAVLAVFAAVILTIGYLLSGLTQSIGVISDQTVPLMLAVDEMDLSRSNVQQFLTDVSATHDPDGYKDAQESAKHFQKVLTSSEPTSPTAMMKASSRNWPLSSRASITSMPWARPWPKPTFEMAWMQAMF